MFKPLHIIRNLLPDDRLAHARISPVDGVMVIEYRKGFIHPQLMREIKELSEGVGQSGMFEIDGETEHPLHVMAWMETGSLGIPMKPRVFPYADIPLVFELQVHSDMVHPTLVREMNEYVYPTVCGAMKLTNGGGAAVPTGGGGDPPQGPSYALR